MKSGATESSFYYLNQYYTIPNNVEISRSIEELAQSKKQYKILWAHDNCDQPQLLRLPELVSQIDRIVCVSNWEREQYIKYNRAPAEKITVIPNGVDEMFRPSGKPKSKTCIFFSAPHKGITPLVPIWKEVIKHHPDAKLKVFSSMSLYGAIQPGEGENETITTENGLEPSPFISIYKELQALPGVEYSPCIDREDLLPHIQDAAFYIHPNVWEETFCVSLAEAMSCGCFPITTDMGALPETSFGRGKYIPMSGQNTPRGWLPDDTFHQNFAKEIIQALSFFDKEPETFYAATNDLASLAIHHYNWKTIARDWSELIEVVTKRAVYIDDEYIFNEVYHKNEYGIETFAPDDIVIDIGAHKGYFTKLCMDMGCKNIHSFEPEPNNFESLIHNLKDYKHFQPYNLAVSDKKGQKNLTVVKGCNTGLHSFYQPRGIPVTVSTIGLDDILAHFSKVSLIKIDTEGSEFEILFNSKLLSKVNKIVGEYHNNITSHNLEDLKKYLEEKNFEVSITRKFNENSGIFVAINNKK
jgi:FkbM family methyltransferase